MAGHCLGWCSGDHVSGTDIYTHTMLTVFERSQSSTYRELVAILFALVSLAQLMFVSRVKWFTDSQGAARIIQVGSMHFNLHNLASDFFFLLLVKLLTTMIGRLFRKYSIYWMAVGVPIPSTVLSRFTTIKFLDFSLGFGTRVSSGVEAFFQVWQGENCWVVTPVVLLSKVFNFLFHSKAQGTLVLSYWPSAPFWPLLVQSRSQRPRSFCPIRWTNVTDALGTRLVLVRTFWRFVVDYRFFEGALALRLGRNTKSLLGSPSWSGHILAVRLVFS